jgi:hypothetical protein
MAIDWTNYKTLTRAEKAVRINQFDREMESIARRAWKGDVHAACSMELVAWVLLLRKLELAAPEIAEAILLCEVPFPYADHDGTGPIGGGEADASANEIIDRAMHMASQWSDAGYPDCFTMHDIGYTKFGRLDRLRVVAKAGECPETFVAKLEAGAVAAKAACDVHNFMMMTERYSSSSAESAASLTP